MTDAPEAPFWEELRIALKWAGQIFGDPVDLYDDRARPRGEVLPLRVWLSALEALARALLFIMASRLPVPTAARKRRSAARSRARGANAVATSKDDLAKTTEPEGTPGSERWAGVVFRVLPPLRAERRRGPKLSHLWQALPTRALAYRFEALIRVAENPTPFAQRLARRLRAKPELAERVLEGASNRSGRSKTWVDLIDDARALAHKAASAFRTETG
jgi:hypothetical protein